MSFPRPRFAFLLSVGMVSASSLAYEVLLMRLFSIIQWHHFAYMIISLALLGYGVSGMVLALNRERLVRRFSLIIASNIFLFGLSLPLCFWLAQNIDFHLLEVLWSPSKWLNLSAVYLLLAVPFFFAANVIGLSFFYYKMDIYSIYTADLLGAGCGSVAVILLLFCAFPQTVLFVLALFVMGAALAVIRYGFDDWNGQITLTLCVSGVFAIFVVAACQAPFELNVSPYKTLNQVLRVPGTEIIDSYSSPLGLIDMVSSPVIPLRHAPGMSLNARSEPPRQLAVFVDANSMSAINAYDGEPATIAYLDQSTSALPYHLSRLSDVLILGAGTGSDVLQARLYRVPHIEAVELNPQLAAMMAGKYADFAGHLYDAANVDLRIGEARGYLAGHSQTYDLINLSLLDSFGSSAAGLYTMAETYLYTEQAIREYLRHLKPGAYLSLTRWVKVPPRDEVKLLATVIKALKRSELIEPARQLMMIRGWQTSTLLIKNGLVSGDDIDRLKRFCNERNFDPVYFPGIRESEVNRFNKQFEPYLYQAMMALLAPSNPIFIDNYKFDIEPVTDDRPYLFHFFKWSSLSESLKLFRGGGGFLLESGYLLLLAALVQAVVFSVLLIALPLWLWKNKLGVHPGNGNYLPVLSYFFCLGLAFLFVEMAFIQKFILILHHPLYAITVVLSAFLLAAGLGSHFSKKLTANSGRSSVLLPVAGLAVFSLVYLSTFDSIAESLLQTSRFSRYFFSILLIMPLGVCMGMPFPTALARLGEARPELLPWAWGVNGCASVISTILATLIAMQFGFTVLILLAIALYVLAVYLFAFFPAKT
ncbi:MAG: SAM-dependent methyltransferase [Gammaproteobacteria bacterium]